MAYFLNVFSVDTWQEFVADGARVSGFSAGMRRQAGTVQPGDTLLCYLKRRLAWIGALEAAGTAYHSDEPLWITGDFPVRLPVRPLITLDIGSPLPMAELEGKLTYFKEGMVPSQYSANLQGSPRRMKDADGDAVLRALRMHEDRGRAVDALREMDAPVVEELPEPDQRHWDMQLLLADWGIQTGCEVWVPRNDRQRLQRRRGAAFPFLDQLPMLFGGRAQDIVENIDVLWLRGGTVVAAFEVEHSTSIYSGLLRMSDLIASIPNIRVSIYIVAPEQRRAQVMREIARPTFKSLATPLHETCGFISYEKLVDQHERLREVLRHVRPEVVKDLAEYVDA